MNVIISVILTAMVYLCMPLILIALNKKFSSTILKIISIVSMCVGILFMSILTGKGGASGGSLLWTLIGYYLMKKRILLSPTTEDSNFIPNSEPNTSALTENSDDLKSQNIKTSTVIFIFIFFIIIALLIPQSIAFWAS